MPYRRRFHRLRRFTRRPRRTYKTRGGFSRWITRPRNAAAMASAAWSTGMFLKKMINTEKKFYDTAISQAGTQLGTVTSLLDIPQGDTGQTRDGRSLRIRSLQLKGQIVQNVSATQTFARVMLIADLRPNAGEISDATAFLQAGSASNVFALASLDVGGRFVTLMDRTYSLLPKIAGTPDARLIKFYHKMDKVVKYAGSATDDPENYNLYLVTISSEATNTPTISAEIRLRFIDN